MTQPETTKDLNDYFITLESDRGNIDYASMVKMVNTTDLKSVAYKGLPVQVRLEAPYNGLIYPKFDW